MQLALLLQAVIASLFQLAFANEFKVTPEDLEKYVTNKTKVLLIGYPNNPTGTVLEKNELLALADFAKKHDLIIMSDEIYGDLTYGDKEHVCVFIFARYARTHHLT